MDIIKSENTEFKLKIQGLLETLPNIRKFSGKYVVVKYGGSILVDRVEDNIVYQLMFLKKYIGINMVVVHGGGRHVDEEMKKRGMSPSVKIGGKRHTPKNVLPILSKCFGELNRRIVNKIKKTGCGAYGFHGRGKTIIEVVKEAEELGYVGKITSVCVKKIKTLPKNCIPVISSLGIDKKGQLYNVNADDVAAAVSVALKAAKFIILTDVKGIMTGKGTGIFSTLNSRDVERIIKEGIVKEGMLPKLKSSVKVVNSGVEKVHIIKGDDTNSIIEEILSSDGVGTQVIK